MRGDRVNHISECMWLCRVKWRTETQEEFGWGVFASCVRVGVEEAVFVRNKVHVHTKYERLHNLHVKQNINVW